MARKKSLWSELQRERERRARAAQAQERANQQLVRQMGQDAERAERRAEGQTPPSGDARSSWRTRQAPRRRRR
jgi:hypothetical protein